MDYNNSHKSISFVPYRKPCRRNKERRSLFFLGGFRGIERRFRKERRKGPIERRKSPA